MIIDLSAPEGNSAALISMAKRIARLMETPHADVLLMEQRLKAGDYNNLLDSLEKEFPGMDFEFINDPRTAQTE